MGHGEQQRGPQLREVWLTEALLSVLTAVPSFSRINSTPQDIDKEFCNMVLEASNAADTTAPTDAEMEKLLDKRTFFLINKSVEPPVIDQRFTGADVRKQLIVEQVDARLTGQPLTMDKLIERFPDAVRTAHYFGVMKTKQKATPKDIDGPFILVSEHDPKDRELLDWYASNKDRVQASGQVPDERLAVPVTLLVKATRKARAKK